MDDMNENEIKRLEMLELIYVSYMVNKEVYNLMLFNSTPVPPKLKPLMTEQYRILQKYGYKDFRW